VRGSGEAWLAQQGELTDLVEEHRPAPRDVEQPDLRTLEERLRKTRAIEAHEGGVADGANAREWRWPIPLSPCREGQK